MKRPPDARLSAARYALEQADPDARTGEQDDDAPVDAGQATLDERAMAVEVAIQQAMRRGDFDRLPGAGKPLPGIGGRQDPDWWIRRKIERERLSGLGPPALTLRTEDAALEERLDALHVESAVREALEDFNARVREARRQLLGGPPVVTRPRDVEAEVAAWRQRAEQRRAERERARDQERRREAELLAAMTWRERRRHRRGAR
ncbi:DUF1992 domain-containing protein [Amnibacterium endophyticum]|uniref:DUF1992 domain-containing protein n=1 Tax=Amnibacterium endophyticum TaxID=2109337 RepID=A0ABW4LEW2_9MICO